MSSIMIHVLPNITHPLTLSMGSMRDICVHASIMACNTTLDNVNHHGARYVSQNIVSITVWDTSLESVYPPDFLILSQFSLVTIMSQNNENDRFTQIMMRWSLSQHFTIHKTMIQQVFQTILNTSHTNK